MKSGYPRLNPNDYDLVQIIGMYTPLVREGRLWRGDERQGGHSSLVVDPDKNLFNWNSRGVSGDVFKWVEMTYHTDFKGAVDIIRNNFPKSYSSLLVEAEDRAYTRLEWALAERHHAALTRTDYAWWQGRGLHAHSVDALCLRVDRAWYTIPIPSADRRYLANYKLRAKYPDMPIRYRQYTKNLEPALYVPFPNLVQESDTIVFVAGEIKAMVLGQYGIPAVSSSTGCATWQRAWTPWFQGKRIVQCFDPGGDEQQAAEKVRSAIQRDLPDAVLRAVIPPYSIDDWIVQHGAGIDEVKEFLHG